jgi:hypothetical protein
MSKTKIAITLDEDYVTERGICRYSLFKKYLKRVDIDKYPAP